MEKQAKVIAFSSLYILGIITFSLNYSLIFAAIIMLVLSFFYFKNKLTTKLFCIFSLIFLIGFLNSFFHFNFNDDMNFYSDKKVNLVVKVLSIPTNNFKDKTKFYAKVLSTNDFYQDKNDKTENLKAKTLVTITDKSGNLKNIKIGDFVELTGVVKIPQYSQNPSQFDYMNYLRLKNTFSLVYAEESWKILKHSDDIKGKFLRKLNDKRNEIISIHALNIKSPMLEILGGIIFGDDAVNPDENTKISFINSGIFHILAASGMNVTLIFGIWLFFARKLQFNYRFSIFTGILLILFYTCMTGFGPPIVRATLMLTLILIGKLIDRTTPTMALLFLVGFLMLLYNPLMLFDIGFQLSFVVTFALILSAPLLNFNFKFKPINYILGSCLIPIIAQLYAAPFQMYYFNTFALYSVLANIAIIPVLSLVSFIGFISSIIALIPIFATHICKFADFILNPFLIYIVKVANFFSNLPYAIIDFKQPNLFQLISYFTFIIFLTLILKYKKFTKKIIISFLIVTLLFLISLIPIKNKNPEIIYFSVGNADSILIKSQNDDYFLIDDGKLPYLNASSQAKNIIIKYFKTKGIKRLNGLILSHFDSDHAGGTIDILKDIKVENVYLTDVEEDTNLTKNIMNFLKDNKLNFKTVDNIEDIYTSDDFKITIIKPKSEDLKEENEKSLIVYVKYFKNEFLFMGDGDVKSYNVLPKEYKEHTTIMKLGHHGAKGVISEEMTKNTDLFVISTGKNFYNHPHTETLEILEKNNKNYLRTDHQNAIKVVLKKDKTQIYMYSPKLKKFVEF
jgi:competence protein ComEC